MKRLLCMLLAAGFLALVLAPAAVAEPATIPNGPWVTPQQDVSLSSVPTVDELGEQLYKIEARSKGRLEVEVAGYSASGYPIYLAKFGEPSPSKRGIMYEAAVHGNELSGILATLDLIQHLATSNSPDVLKILETHTIWFLPMVNPDGAMYEIDGQRVTRRYNNQSWTPLEWGLPLTTPAPNYFVRATSTRPSGYDINRDFNWDLDFVLNDPAQLNYKVFGYFVTPEARTWVRVFKELRPKFLFSSHHQGSMTTDEPGSIDLVQFSLNGQAVRPTGELDMYGNLVPVDPALITLGRQVVINIYQELGNQFPGVFARYCPDDESHIPRCTQACATFNGCAIFILETRYQGIQKALGMQVAVQEKIFWLTMNAFVTGEVFSIDEALYQEIPIQTYNVRNPHV